MLNYRPVTGSKFIWVALALLAVITVGCQAGLVNTVPGELTPTPDPTSTRPAQTPVAQSLIATASPSPTATESTQSDDPETRTITLWTIEQISPEAEGEIGGFFSSSLRAFSRNKANAKVEVLLKKPSGKGGMLDFLRASKEVAPTILPDVAIINTTDLSQVVAADLIQPLDGRLDRSIVQDLIPAARKMGTVNGQLYGVPLGIDMEHTVYNGLVFENPPLLWTDIFTAQTRYLFPAKGENGLVNDLTLAQYFSAGGKVLDDQGKPTLDAGILQEVLEIYAQALETNTIDASILEAATTEELWPLYVQREAGIAQISTRQYLIDRELLNNTNFVTMPVRSEGQVPILITHGWVLVLVTGPDDLEQQAAALSLIEWFMSITNNATWNQINNSIPTRDTSFQEIAGNDPYWIFLGEQLNAAQPQPGFDGYDRYGRIVQQAVVQVISGEATPQEATATAIDALTLQ